MGRLFASPRPRSRILHHLHTAISQSASSIQPPRTRLDEHFHLEIPSRSGRERIPGHALVQLAIACRAPAVPVLPCRELVRHVGWTASSATLRPALWKNAAGNSNRSTLRVQLSSVGLHAAILHVLLLLLSIRRLPRRCYSSRLLSIARARLWRASRRPQRAAGSRYLCVLLPTHGPPAAAIRLRTRPLALIQIPVGLFECISQQESLRTETEQTGHAIRRQPLSLQSPQHSASVPSGTLSLRSSPRRAICFAAVERACRCFAGCSDTFSISRNLRCARKSRNLTAIAEIPSRSATSCVEYCKTSRSKHTCRRSGASCVITSIDAFAAMRETHACRSSRFSPGVPANCSSRVITFRNATWRTSSASAGLRVSRSAPKYSPGAYGRISLASDSRSPLRACRSNAERVAPSRHKEVLHMVRLRLAGQSPP